MPSALTNIIKCLMICKTKCHCKSKCSNCMEIELNFEEGPKSLPDTRQNSSSDDNYTQSEKINEFHKISKDNINTSKNADAITSDL